MEFIGHIKTKTRVSKCFPCSLVYKIKKHRGYDGIGNKAKANETKCQYRNTGSISPIYLSYC